MVQKKIVYDRLVFYPGDEIFAEGDEPNWAYLIQSGEIEIVKKTARGEEVRLSVLEAGRLFGEMALLEERPRMASARALSKTVCVLISAKVLQDRVEQSDPLVRALLMNLSDKLRKSGPN